MVSGVIPKTDKGRSFWLGRGFNKRSEPEWGVTGDTRGKTTREVYVEIVPYLLSSYLSKPPKPRLQPFFLPPFFFPSHSTDSHPSCRMTEPLFHRKNLISQEPSFVSCNLLRLPVSIDSVLGGTTESYLNL